MSKKGGLIPGTEAGYMYDWNRQHMNAKAQRSKKRSETQKKIDKVMKKNRPIKKR